MPNELGRYGHYITPYSHQGIRYWAETWNLSALAADGNDIPLEDLAWLRSEMGTPILRKIGIFWYASASGAGTHLRASLYMRDTPGFAPDFAQRDMSMPLFSITSPASLRIYEEVVGFMPCDWWNTFTAMTEKSVVFRIENDPAAANADDIYVMFEGMLIDDPNAIVPQQVSAPTPIRVQEYSWPLKRVSSREGGQL